MKWLNMRLWLNSSQRRALETGCYLAVLGIGCIAGTLFMLTDTGSSLCRFCLAYALPQTDGNVLLSAFRWCAGVLILGFFLGFCGIGQPLIITLLAFHGFSAGCCLTSLSMNIAADAPLIYACAALYTAAASFTLLLGMRESARLSCVSMKSCLSENDSFNMRRRFRMYCIRYIVLLLMILAEGAGFAAVCKLL